MSTNSFNAVGGSMYRRIFREIIFYVFCVSSHIQDENKKITFSKSEEGRGLLPREMCILLVLIKSKSPKKRRLMWLNTNGNNE